MATYMNAKGFANASADRRYIPIVLTYRDGCKLDRTDKQRALFNAALPIIHHNFMLTDEVRANAPWYMGADPDFERPVGSDYLSNQFDPYANTACTMLNAFVKVAIEFYNPGIKSHHGIADYIEDTSETLLAEIKHILPDNYKHIADKTRENINAFFTAINQKDFHELPECDRSKRVYAELEPMIAVFRKIANIFKRIEAIRNGEKPSTDEMLEQVSEKVDDVKKTTKEIQHRQRSRARRENADHAELKQICTNGTRKSGRRKNAQSDFQVKFIRAAVEEAQKHPETNPTQCFRNIYNRWRSLYPEDVPIAYKNVGTFQATARRECVRLGILKPVRKST